MIDIDIRTCNLRSRPFCFPAILTVFLLCAGIAQARVVRIEVDHREPARGGKVFAVGAYEAISGRFFGELDPANALNAIINDLSLAPRNARGNVEYSATFELLVPANAAKISGIMLYEVPNRGNAPIDSGDFADAFNAGHVLLSSGWQGDVQPGGRMQTISVPAATNTDGSAITGPVLARLSDLPAGANTASLTTGYRGLRYQRPATLDTSKALLTSQASDDGQQLPIAASGWAFANCEKTPFPGEPDPTKICLKGGFDSNLLYQLVYTAKDPLVLGIGLAATRDIVSFFRHGSKDDAGNPNPLPVRTQHAIAFGTSQSGNFLKTFLNLGFNQDEKKRIVFDGLNSHISGRQTPINFRFAIPGGATGLYEPGSEGTLWWSDYRDVARHRPTAGLMDRCRATHTCPKIMETFGSTEFWGLRMSPDLVGTEADTDIPLPDEVRRYYFPGVTHGGGGGGFNVLSRPASSCTLPANPNSMAESMRALRQQLIAWVANNQEPPASRYPRLDHGDLVAPEHIAMGYPEIPDEPLPDTLINRFWEYDFGPAFHDNDLSGAITIQPPIIRGMISMLVPRTDADGNEVGGIPSVLHQAPLGTYLGWNVTASGYLKGRECGFMGGFIPFARTRAERIARGDPRPSLEERYGSHTNYVAKVKAAAQSLVEQRFLLPEDAARLVNQAEASDVLR